MNLLQHPKISSLDILAWMMLEVLDFGIWDNIKVLHSQKKKTALRLLAINKLINQAVLVTEGMHMKILDYIVDSAFGGSHEFPGGSKKFSWNCSQYLKVWQSLWSLVTTIHDVSCWFWSFWDDSFASALSLYEMNWVSFCRSAGALCQCSWHCQCDSVVYKLFELLTILSFARKVFLTTY